MNHLAFYWGNVHKVTWIESLRKSEKLSLVEAVPNPADTCTSTVFLDFSNKVSFLPQKQSFRKHYEDSPWDQQCVGKTAGQYFSVINLWSRNPMNEDFIKDHKCFIAHIFFYNFYYVGRNFIPKWMCFQSLNNIASVVYKSRHLCKKRNEFWFL